MSPVTWRGESLCGRRVDGFTAKDAAESNLRLVTGVLEAGGIDYFLVPGKNRTGHCVGVARGDRDRFLALVAERHGSGPLLVGVPKGGGRMTQISFASGRIPRSDVLRFCELRLGARGQVLGGYELGCDVEFWRDGSELVGEGGNSFLKRLRIQDGEEVLRGALVAPRHNRVADMLPQDMRKPAWAEVGARQIPTFEVFTATTPEDVTFPIDVVYTWVDGQEPALREKRARYLPEEKRDVAPWEFGESRYTSHDELKYSLRSLEMYAPFVRNVYIVTDGQTPSWLDTSQDRVRVVDHREIFPEDALPVFNSHAIETRLHHIPGLSEHYLYLNDDVFFGRPVTPQHFFHGNGIIKVPVSPFKISLGSGAPGATAPNAAGGNVRALLHRSRGSFVTQRFLHTPHPQRKSVLSEIEREFSADFARTTRSRFRSASDIAPVSMAHHYAMITGRGVSGKYRYRYLDIAGEKAEGQFRELERDRSYDLFCVNDVDSDNRQRRRMREFLEGYFPFAASWEGAHRFGQRSDLAA
ncbi:MULTISPECIES: stealth family protein [unclassified Nocardiopsis]|uniref:stealth family protein n=2 Tax=Nocardiopsis TaxID=2013 RepID=UPI0019167C8C|nr:MULTISPECIES: stealth family protein [unclassified Nocardiopsis]